MAPRTADELRAAFLDFFAARGHSVVPSASLIPHDPSVLFTMAGMLPFKPYFVGDEPAPWARATSVQKCVRAGGKHNDLEMVGRSNRHLTFFEMLGNFSFGDYFKAEAIPWAWELITDVFGLDPARLWVTVHESDDEAEAIWRDTVGVAADRIQRLGEDNWWGMADTGPCGPSSEIFLDLGPEYGAAGGPAANEDRYLEFWNLVFMQFDAQPDGSLVPLPAPSVDTGAGFERTLAVLQGVETVWEIDSFRPLLDAAAAVTGVTYGGFPGTMSDVSLRILAEHGRTMTFLVSDDVVPSNEERGYVLRRIIRRAVRHAYLLGVQDLVTPALVDATVSTMGGAYPELVRDQERITTIVSREEARFRQTLVRGVELLEELVAQGDVSGQDAFFLHDSLGFPIDLTREIAEERGRGVDLAGFETRMAQQRTRALAAHKAAAGAGTVPVEVYRELFEEIGPVEFTGRQEDTTHGAKIRGLVASGARVRDVGPEDLEGGALEVVLDRTPFYAESGGQVGDTGTITTSGGAVLRVLDTQSGLGDLTVHHCALEDGRVREGDECVAAIDGARRDRIRRNHTATHLLHWALRETLGSEVKQAGSHVGPDRLRFDFSHHEALSPEQIEHVEALANDEVITDAPVRHYETTKDHAESLGALAFFGDKYGDLVRVLEAGDHSLELCGGTHVHALGFIGPVKIVAEGSVGANLRRIEAVTGDGALEYIRDEEHTLRDAAALLKVAPQELTERITRLLGDVKSLRDDLETAQARGAVADAAALAAEATDGVVVARRDGLAGDALRRLALATRDALGSGLVGLVGLAPDGEKASVVVAVSKDLVARDVAAGAIAADAARALGGGTGKQADVAVGGGPGVDAIEAALALLVQRAKEASGVAPDAR